MKILILTPRFPLPTFKGDKLRIWQIIRKLATAHELTLLSYIDESERQYIKEVSQFCDVKTVPGNLPDIFFETFRGIGSGWPLQVHMFSSKRMMELVAGSIKDADLVHLSTIRMFGNLPANFDGKFSIDFIDALSLNFERRMKNSRTPLKYVYKLEYDRLIRFESMMGKRASLAYAVSTIDANTIGNGVRVLPNSVDTDTFSPPPVQQARSDIIFTGNLSYTPNIEAVETIAMHVMPLVNRIMPDLKLNVVGINPHPRVKALESENVRIVGYVDSLADEVGRAKVAVAPMVSGSGLQNKILEAMACATPVVSTTIGNAGINAGNNKDIMLADTPQDFAEKIIALAGDSNLAKNIGYAGRHFVVENFGWESTCQKLLEMYEEIW